MNLDLQAICNEVMVLAEAGANFIRKEGQSFDASRIEHKSPIDLVSYVDKETERMLVAGLKEIVPQAGFVTEEGTVAQVTAGLRWVIDPLDGTTNFMHQLPPFCVSIALMDDDEVLVGVVYEVVLKECFCAWKGGGAWCNGKPIRVSKAKSISESLIAVGFPYKINERKDMYFGMAKSLVGNSHGLRTLGSAAIDMAYVACGRLDAYVEFNVFLWDLAAGIIILKEAGGKVTDYSGGNGYLTGSQVIAAGGIHAELLAWVQGYWKE